VDMLMIVGAAKNYLETNRWCVKPSRQMCCKNTYVSPVFITFHEFAESLGRGKTN
jgi:hypothetical protein